jgi:hypothetical protein
VTQQLYPEYVRPVREGRIQASQHQQLYNAFKDKAVAARAAFESGLHNQLTLSDAVTNRFFQLSHKTALLCRAAPMSSTTSQL